MSRFLSEPSREKDTVRGDGNGFVYGRSAMQGWRDSMEDAHLEKIIVPEIPGTSVFGVFDGHGGSLISQEVSKTILSSVFSTEEFARDKTPKGLAKAICRGFIAADKALREKADIRQHADEVGSTCVLCFISPESIIVANVGDSRAIMSADGHTIPLSMDHKPTLEIEKTRIEAAGGSVFRGRVCGGVSVSRSFGDFWFKRNQKLKEHQQQVTAEPTLCIHERMQQDEFVLLACDGIYDVLTNAQARKFVADKLRSGIMDPGMICEMLLDECLARGSRDNMSAILVVFNSAIQSSHHQSKDASCSVM